MEKFQYQTFFLKKNSTEDHAFDESLKVESPDKKKSLSHLSFKALNLQDSVMNGAVFFYYFILFYFFFFFRY